MNSGSEISDEVQRFRSCVAKLSGGIKEAGVNWHDEKYEALSKMVSDIASQSKMVMEYADKFLSGVKQFGQIAAK
ncbi:MAG: hypothetical protein IJS67_05425 [Clostridia bacterium]|nr:hypothetical protein [Clostridia bacterium]